MRRLAAEVDSAATRDPRASQKNADWGATAQTRREERESSKLPEQSPILASSARPNWHRSEFASRPASPMRELWQCVCVAAWGGDSNPRAASLPILAAARGRSRVRDRRSSEFSDLTAQVDAHKVNERRENSLRSPERCWWCSDYSRISTNSKSKIKTACGPIVGGEPRSP